MYFTGNSRRGQSDATINSGDVSDSQPGCYRDAPVDPTDVLFSGVGRCSEIVKTQHDSRATGVINREGECNLVILVYLKCPVLLVRQLPCQLLKNYKEQCVKD